MWNRPPKSLEPSSPASSSLHSDRICELGATRFGRSTHVHSA
ncbi:hypothetical protein SAMN02745866_00514 [Alteromonadaceae bacterium Bs31]|nr:hypothetical protein SAMN02745866_00514 [Alteromonadaceae bacterium Bs31]